MRNRGSFGQISWAENENESARAQGCLRASHDMHAALRRRRTPPAAELPCGRFARLQTAPAACSETELQEQRRSRPGECFELRREPRGSVSYPVQNTLTRRWPRQHVLFLSILTICGRSFIAHEFNLSEVCFRPAFFHFRKQESTSNGVLKPSRCIQNQASSRPPGVSETLKYSHQDVGVVCLSHATHTPNALAAPSATNSGCTAALILSRSTPEKASSKSRSPSQLRLRYSRA